MYINNEHLFRGAQFQSGCVVPRIQCVAEGPSTTIVFPHFYTTSISQIMQLINQLGSTLTTLLYYIFVAMNQISMDISKANREKLGVTKYNLFIPFILTLHDYCQSDSISFSGREMEMNVVFL